MGTYLSLICICSIAASKASRCWGGNPSMPSGAEFIVNSCEGYAMVTGYTLTAITRKSNMNPTTKQNHSLARPCVLDHNASMFLNSSLLILPVAVCGICGTNTTSSGIHHLASLPSKNAKTLCFVRPDALDNAADACGDHVAPPEGVAGAVAPSGSTGTTASSGRSVHLGSGTPITAASATCCFSCPFMHGQCSYMGG